MLGLAVLAQALAMVAGDDDRLRARDPVEGLDDPPELLVHRGHFPQVGVLRVAAAERLGRRVRRVRLVVMDPEEERLRGSGAQKRECSLGRLAAGAFRAPGRELVVVDVEASREPEAAGERKRRNERAGPVARLSKPLGGDGPILREVPGVFMDAVPRRLQARHHGGVGR